MGPNKTTESENSNQIHYTETEEYGTTCALFY